LKNHAGESIHVDGVPGAAGKLDPSRTHDINIEVSGRNAVRAAYSLGVFAVTVRSGGAEKVLSGAPVCLRCGAMFSVLEPMHFRLRCLKCRGHGCPACGGTGLPPEAAAARFHGRVFPELLALSVRQAIRFFQTGPLPASASRLESEITRRLEAMEALGLGYVGLDRRAPTLSRGEAQRLRLSVALTSGLEDVLHVLDEPTIGLHPLDVLRMIPAFRRLAGPVVFIEHDRIAASQADRAIDLGPGAGSEGGRLLHEGTPKGLWRTGTKTGRFFSLRAAPAVPPHRPPAEAWITVRGAELRNLAGIDVPFPLGRLTVVTGVSGSGKSTLVLDVIAASLSARKPLGCSAMEGPALAPVVVDQDPIGLTPRSNPATYTKLADVIRDRFARETGLSASCFSFNRPEGACEECGGIGAREVRMRYLPPTWIPCAACGGRRFSERVLAARASFSDRALSIAELYDLCLSG
jgi:excinuclease ABC subunit A